MRSLALCGTLAAALVAPPGPPPRPAPVRAVLDEPKATITAQAVKPRGATKAWEVHKFGGASLATAELYRTVGDLLLDEATREEGVELHHGRPASGRRGGGARGAGHRGGVLGEQRGDPAPSRPRRRRAAAAPSAGCVVQEILCPRGSSIETPQLRCTGSRSQLYDLRAICEVVGAA